MVEAQHIVSTLKLTDTLEEQSLLESLLEETKPLVPPECGHLDYLLATPFRYAAVYPHGSRFRRAGRTAGVFYAAETEEAAVAETAFYRLLFFAESPDTPWPANAAAFTAFSASLSAAACLDLTRPPLDRDHSSWTDPLDYAACQALADAARDAGIGVLRYRSVRDPAGGCNVAVLTCAAFAEPRPTDPGTWRIKLGAKGVQAVREFPRLRLEYDRTAFISDPRIAAMRWERA